MIGKEKLRYRVTDTLLTCICYMATVSIVCHHYFMQIICYLHWEPESHEPLVFACLHEDAKQCFEVKKLGCVQ